MKRKVFAVLFIAVFATMMGINIIEPLMAIYSESLGASGFFIGLIFAAATIGRGIATPIIGRISDYHGRRKFIIAGLFAYTVISFLYIIATRLDTLIAVRFLQGIAAAFVAPIAMAYIGEIAPKGQEGKYMGTFSMSMFLGLAAGPVVGGTLNHYLHMNAAFIAMGLLGLASLAIVVVMLPELGLHRKRKLSSIRAVLTHRTVQALLAMRFFTSFGLSAFIVFLPLYAEKLGIDTAKIGIMVSANLLVTTLMQRHFGRMADKRSKVMMMVAGSIIMAAMIAAIPFTGSFAVLLALNVAMGLGAAVSTPANIAMIAQLGREYGMGTLMGLLNTVFALGFAAGPLIAGVVLDFTGLKGVFIYTAATVIAGAVLFYWLMGRNGIKTANPAAA